MPDRDGIVILRRCLIAGNAFIWLFGIGVLVFAMWLFFDTGNADAPEKLDQHLRYLHTDLNYYYAAVYLLIGTGVIILFIGVFGWLGAYRESINLLTAYSAIMLLVVAGHLAAASVSIANRDTIQVAISQGIKSAVEQQYGDLREHYRATQIIDYIQRRFNCCGGLEYEDWSNSKWKEEPAYAEDEVVPASCCFGSSELDFICPTYSSILGGKNPYLHQTGCGTKIKRRIMDSITGITAGGFSIVFLEVLAIALTVLMINKLNAEDKRIY
ncbi:CD151 antigen-like [Watersipora subatra]|uniref:CD151 antigen-like n=1 Tax=Watersipora subatra TaxID=2589382 RepID=UPI00355C703A